MSRNKFYDQTISSIKAKFTNETALDILDNDNEIKTTK